LRKHPKGVESKTWDITPQVASQLLGMAQYKAKINKYPTTTDVHLIEIRGQYFSFWKAMFSKQSLKAIIDGFPLEQPIDLLYNRKEDGIAAECGYDFSDPNQRKIIMDVIMSYIYTCMPRV